MNQVDLDETAAASAHPVKEPATAAAVAAAAWPTAACSAGVGNCSEGFEGAADSTHGQSGGPSQAPASASAATTAAAVSNNIASAIAAAAAATAAATASCAAAAAAATVAAAAVTTSADKHGNAFNTFAAEGEGAPASVTAADVGTTAAAGSDRDSHGGSAVSGASLAVEEGDQARAAKPPRSLAAWLKEGPFALSMSPGFFGFYAHIGALIALEAEGLLEGVSFATGASAGGLVAGLFAAGLSPADMGETVVKFRRSDFWDPVGVGGLLRGKKFEEIVKATLPPGVRRFDQCRVPLAVSAFDALRLTTRTLAEGCVAQALRATCTFPILFAPVWHKEGVLVDGGVRDTTGMWCVPEGREGCRRVLNVTFGAKDGRGVCVPPSSFPTASNPRPTADGMEIVSLALGGLPRPHPFAMERGADAMEAARSQVAAAVGLPLQQGHEESHWIAATSTQPPPACARHGMVGNPRDTSVGGSTASLNGTRVEVVGKRAAASGKNSTRIGGSVLDTSRGAYPAAPGTVSSEGSTTHAVPAATSTAVAAAGRAAMAPSTSTAVDVTSRAAAPAATFPAGHEERGREAGQGAPAATAVPVPVTGAALAATGPTKPPGDRPHARQDAPQTPGAVEKKDGKKKRRRVGGVARLRGFNRQGLAIDGSGDGRRQSGKRAPGAAEEGAPSGRTSKRARQPKVQWNSLDGKLTSK